MTSAIDIKENDIIKSDKELLKILLKDNSTKKNILWATDNYEHLGDGYGAEEHITIKAITGKNDGVIRPRVKKSKAEQKTRSREKAEVFTPSWICNLQNNLIDNSWFGLNEDIFNVEGEKSWQSIARPIPFPSAEGKGWRDYIGNTCLEITCGEAPYLVSRYDTITGEPIAIGDRIGLLDRKLRIVSENASDEEEWCTWAEKSVQNIYGFEWQGDSLLLARENILYTYIDYYEAKFGKYPPEQTLREIAKIVAWNIWQMDGLKGVVPNSCRPLVEITTDLFEGEIRTEKPCPGCAKLGNMKNHTGIYCKIKDWKESEIVTFASLLKR